jgi:Mg2+ and Co2+ transporter CorA
MIVDSAVYVGGRRTAEALSPEETCEAVRPQEGGLAWIGLHPPTEEEFSYGMNFDHMPELRWPLGYPFALALMLVVSVSPYLAFKRRGWL